MQSPPSLSDRRGVEEGGVVSVTSNNRRLLLKPLPPLRIRALHRNQETLAHLPRSLSNCHYDNAFSYMSYQLSSYFCHVIDLLYLPI